MAQIRFVQSASRYNQFPTSQRPQVAIAGRSNSGKSSFINSLARQKIAQVSSTPGKTRLLNIFDVNQKYWLIDMPGYGYAARSKSERRDWEKMIEPYINESEQLRGLILLMDIRRNWGDEEALLVDYCAALDLPLVLGLTKADKMSRSQWLQIVKKNEMALGIPCFPLSSLKKWGMDELMEYVFKSWIAQKSQPAPSDDKPTEV